jgi:3-oxoadipate enol-lactonase
MRAVKLNGAVMHFREDGDAGGRPLLFINSLGTDFRVWDKVVPLMPDDLRLIRYDKRGHGLSELTPGPYSIDQLADDAAALLDHLALRGAIVVGLSIGGLIGQSLAARRPDLVRALVLMDTAAKIGTEEMWAERIATVEAEGIEALADAVMTRWFSKGFAKNHAVEMAAWRNMLTRTPDAGYAACSAAIAAADYTESTKTLSIPVLAMAGDEDGSTPPDLVRATAKLIKGARYETIEQAGHLPGVERPNTVAGLIIGFLQDCNLAN